MVVLLAVLLGILCAIFAGFGIAAAYVCLTEESKGEENGAA